MHATAMMMEWRENGECFGIFQWGNQIKMQSQIKLTISLIQKLNYIEYRKSELWLEICHCDVKVKSISF